MIDSLKFNLKSIDEELYPLIKILKKKIIRVLDQVEKKSFDDFFVGLTFDISEIEKVSDSISDLLIIIPENTLPDLKDKLFETKDHLDGLKDNGQEIILYNHRGNIIKFNNSPKEKVDL